MVVHQGIFVQSPIDLPKMSNCEVGINLILIGDCNFYLEFLESKSCK